MTDPFAPMTVVTPTRPRPMAANPPWDRLRRLGASDTVRDEVRRRWAAFSDSEKAVAAADLAAMSDEEVRRHVLEMEAERVAEFAGVTSYELRPVVGYLREPDEVPLRTVKAALGWVDGDAARALAALTIELREAEVARRSTLIDALRSVLDG